MYTVRFIISTLFIVFSVTGYSQTFTRQLHWMEPVPVFYEDGTAAKALYFKGALIEAPDRLPVFSEIIEISGSEIPEVTIDKYLTSPLTQSEISLIAPEVRLARQLSPVTEIVYLRKKPALKIMLNTIVLLNDGSPARLQSVTFTIKSTSAGNLKASDGAENYSDNSVLANGIWYKFKTNQTGVHKITYDNLVQMGINPESINPKNIRIYGNGGGMLPERNADFRYDDLQENAIFVEGETDTKFDRTDYILFYATAPDTWKFKASNSTFYHVRNVYSDFTYYFLTTDLGAGKRTGNEPSLQDVPNHTVTTFNDYAFHETDSYNLIKSGREWYGEVFDIVTDYNFTFDFPDIDPSFPATITTKVVARSNIQSFFWFSVNDQLV